MTLPPEDRNAELRELFFETAQELLQALNEQAMRLETSPGEAETLRGLRRTVHTLKGDAAACGYRELSELAHEVEDVLMLDAVATAASVPDIALRAADAFAAMLESYRHQKELPDVQPLRQAIAQLAPPRAPGDAGKKPAKTVGPAVDWSEYEQLAITKALEKGQNVYQISVRLDPQCGMPIAARQLIKVALAATGEVLAVCPADGSAGPKDRLEWALASERPADEIRQKCQIPTITSSAQVTALPSPATLRTGSLPNAQGPESRPEMAGPASEFPAPPDAPLAAGPPAHAVSAGPDSILRVDAEKIDTLLNLVGELILVKSTLQQTLHEFSHRFPKEPLRGKFSDAMAFQARVLNDLQRSVMKIRMVPVEQLFRRFPRVVRDVARECGKEVELVVQGEGTDLDKGILDALAEPLTHLVRNAIAHGMEDGAERTRVGKRAQGVLRLNAYHQGNQVVIEVSDDGRGIAVEKIRQRARDQGLLTVEQVSRLSEAETLELVFRPGFTTAEQITELSGRGVGLDVVQSVLQRLKGRVQIETEPGRGTTFRLWLPLTLAIIKALLFRVERRLYAVPLGAVVEIARTREQEVHQVEHYEVLQLRNEVLPLLRLGQLPAAGPDSGKNKVFTLVIQIGGRKFGLLVDALEGEDELVIKALDDQSISTDLVSGASILGDGRVVLILNLTALVDRFTRARPDQPGERMSGLLLSGADRALRNGSAAGGQA